MMGFNPSSTELTKISQAIARLEASLVPASEAEAAVEIAKLLAAFPAPGQSDSPAALRMDAYFEALNEAPIWAITEARRSVVRGETELDGRFAPSPPQFAKLVKSTVSSVSRDLSDLLMIEAASENSRPISDGEKASVARRFDEERERLRSTAAVDQLATRAASLGIDPEALSALPDAPPRTTAMKRAAFTPTAPVE